MSQPRFLADHDLNEHIIVGVVRQEPSINCTRARDIGMSEASDREILEYANNQSMLVVSHDVNTMPEAAYSLLATGETMAGLLMVPQTKPIKSIIDSIVLIWSSCESEEWNGSVTYLPLA